MMKVSGLILASGMGVILSVLTLCLQYKHLLSVLLSLEAMTLSLFVMLAGVSSGFSLEGEMCLILITMGACEASLGLAILVSLIRTHGNDYVSSFSAQKC
uniref:NADH-ubiquinone oxidoreductase chain 4L n=1 Tax=Umbonium thomasi TaxID=307063 RepID=A0A481U8C2_9VEST|nr:NADH dehydrogenase subunit 4L [Umbonium thomasi]QBI37700.1 NADH dehydrogenase subunit 4L [Umbonium thomasi]